MSNRNIRSSANSTSQDAFGTQAPGGLQRKPANQIHEGSKSGDLAYLLGLKSKNSLPSYHNDRRAANDIRPDEAPAVMNAIRKKCVLMPVSGDRVLKMTSKLEAKANEQQNQPPLSSRIQSSDPKSQGSFVKTSDPENTSALFSDDSEKENSQESLRSGRPAVDGLKSESIQPAKAEQPTAQISIIDQFQDSNPFRGFKRVPRRYVRIPESQRSLLERKDSWYDPQAGTRPTYAIIPAKVRDDLTAFLERRLTSRRPSRGSQENEVDSDDSDDQQTQHNPKTFEIERLEEEEANLGSVEGGRNQKYLPRIHLDTPHTEVKHARLSDKDQKSASHSDHQHKSIISSTIPDGSKEKMDEASHSKGNDTSDEESLPWTSSPERNPQEVEYGIKSSNDQTNSNNHRGGSPELSGSIRHCLNSLLRQQETDMSAEASVASQFPEPKPSLTALCDNNSVPQKPQSTGRVRAPVVIPSSSPVEEELEFVIPYAIGELVEGSSSEEDSSETFQKHPSTALQNPKLVQVEQTPFPQFRRPDGRSPRWKHDGWLKERKRDDNIISSGPRIPSTCEAPNSKETISSSREKERPAFEKDSEMQTLVVEYRSDEPQHPSHLLARISLEEEHEDNDLVQKQLFLEHESSQRDRSVPSSTVVHATLSLDVTKSPKLSSTENRIPAATLPRNLTSGHHVPSPHSSPFETPTSDKRRFDESSPATMGPLKRGGDVFGGSPQNPPKRRRRIASMIMEEEYAARDSKEMARINRHSFNDRLSLAAEITTPIIPPRSLPGSPRSKVIPSTNPEVASTQSHLPEPQFQSSSTDGVHHVPATFEEPTSISRSVVLQAVHIPTQTAEIGEDPAAATLISEIESNGSLDTERDDAILKASLIPKMEPETHSQLDFYDEFIYVYRDYLGSKNDFTWALVYIEWLREGKQFLHRALCDDFIRILSSDYKTYAAESKSLTGTTMTGWEFFHAKNENPVFIHEVITPENLQDALASLHAEQVAKVRKIFAKTVQVTDKQESVLQESAKIFAPTQPLSDLDIQNASPQNLVPEGQASHSHGREASQELVSANDSNFSGAVQRASAESQFLSYSREASPELGSANGSSRSIHHIPRKPYFEAPSQLPIAQRQLGAVHSHPSALVDLTSSDCRTNSRKSLPWTKEHSPRSTKLQSPELESMSSSSITPARRNGGVNRSGERRKTSRSKPQSPPSPESPILDSVSESLSRTARQARANSSKPPSHEPDAFKQRPSPVSKVSSLSRTYLPKETTGDPERVERWRTEVIPKKRSFKDFAREFARRKSSSNVPTPNSTPNKRLCTKPKVSPAQFEPETQGWS